MQPQRRTRPNGVSWLSLRVQKKIINMFLGWKRGKPARRLTNAMQVYDKRWAKTRRWDDSPSPLHCPFRCSIILFILLFPRIFTRITRELGVRAWQYVVPLSHCWRCSCTMGKQTRGTSASPSSGSRLSTAHACADCNAAGKTTHTRTHTQILVPSSLELLYFPFFFLYV